MPNSTSNGEARPEGRLRSSGIGILAGAIMLLLLSIGGFLGFYLLPILHVKSALREAYRLHEARPSWDEIVQNLGGPERAASRIDRYLNCPNWLSGRKSRWWGAINVLSACGRHGVPGLLEQLDHASFEEKMMILGALEGMGPEAKDAIPAIIGCLHDSNDLVQLYAANALSKIPDASENAVAVLCRDLFKDSDNGVRARAAAALGVLGSIGASRNEVVSFLVESMKRDQDQHVRQAAAKALGEIGPEARKALSALESLSGDVSPDVRRAAAEAIKKIRGEVKGSNGLEGKNSPDPGRREAVGAE